MKPTKIISGGQTGADLGGLIAAQWLDIPTGGLMPKGCRTENGPRPDIRDQYGLTEATDSDYRSRTIANVIAADATILFGDTKSAGSALTIRACREVKRPCLVNPGPLGLREWVAVNGYQTLNIAGNRESVNPGIQLKVYDLLVEAFGKKE